MLRNAVLFIALLLAAVGVWLLVQKVWVPGLQVLGLALLVFLGTAFEHWRYRTGPPPPGAQWQRTEEKFADPISGEEMEVQYDPRSGERRYVRR
jgi:multisubunit Na+/H+ antiporter MnhC subunit